MMQSRYHSLVEAVANTAVGYAINFVGQLIIFPMVGIKASVGQNIKVGLLFTCISVARQYIIRRRFTKKTEA